MVPVTAAEIIGLVLALLIMGVGVVGCVLPGLPGTPLVLAAALVHKLVFGQAGASWWIWIWRSSSTGSITTS